MAVGFIVSQIKIVLLPSLFIADIQSQLNKMDEMSISWTKEGLFV